MARCRRLYNLYLQFVWTVAAVSYFFPGSALSLEGVLPGRLLAQVSKGFSDGPVILGFAPLANDTAYVPYDSIQMCNASINSIEEGVAICAKACNGSATACPGFTYVPETNSWPSKCCFLYRSVYSGGFWQFPKPSGLVYSRIPAAPVGYMYASQLFPALGGAHASPSIARFAAGSLENCSSSCTKEKACAGFNYFIYASPYYPDCTLYSKLVQPFMFFDDMMHMATFWKLTNGSCQVSAWSPWSSCVNGTQTSTRTIKSPGAGKNCPQLVRTQKCSSAICQVSDWSAWGPCINGKQNSTRKITKPGANCPSLVRTQNCTVAGCQVSDWSVFWGPCVNGKQNSTRTIIKPGPDCPSLVRTQNCPAAAELGFAPVTNDAVHAPLDSKQISVTAMSTEEAVAICAKACADSATACPGFVYDLERYKCYLYPSVPTGGFRQFSRPTGLLYSRIPVAPDGYMYSSPLFPGWGRAGASPAITSFTAGSLGKCSSNCTNDKACGGFNYLTYAYPMSGYPDCTIYSNLVQPFSVFSDDMVHMATFWKLTTGKCQVSAWSPWSSCVNGTQTSTRNITNPGAGTDCPQLVRTQKCSSLCSLSAWTPWGPCINDTQQSVRYVVTPGDSCPYELTRSQNCTSCRVSDWSNWGECINGKQNSTRTITRPGLDCPFPLVRTQNCTDPWAPYRWSSLDRSVMKYFRFDEPTICEDVGGTYTRGNNAAYRGCGTSWCCVTSGATPKPWRRYGWSNLEDDLQQYGNQTSTKLCTDAGAVWRGYFTSELSRYPGCPAGPCCISANASFPAWRPYGWSAVEGVLLAGGRSEASLCTDARGTYTGGVNGAYPGCGTARCCVSVDASFPVDCVFSNWTTSKCIGGKETHSRYLQKYGKDCPRPQDMLLSFDYSCQDSNNGFSSCDDVRCPGVEGYVWSNPMDYRVPKPVDKRCGNTIQTCASQCNQISSCAGFNFVPDGVDATCCYLYKVPIPNGFYASTLLSKPGITYSKIPGQVDSFTAFSGMTVDFSGSGIYSSGESLQSCATSCRSDPACGGFTFRPTDSVGTCMTFRTISPPYRVDTYPDSYLTRLTITYKRSKPGQCLDAILGEDGWPASVGRCPYVTGTFVNCTNIDTVYVVSKGMAYPIYPGIYKYTLKSPTVLSHTDKCCATLVNGCGVGSTINGPWGDYTMGSILSVNGAKYFWDNGGFARPFSDAGYRAAGQPPVIQNLTSVPRVRDEAIPGLPIGFYLGRVYIMRLVTNDVPRWLLSTVNPASLIWSGPGPTPDESYTFTTYVSDDSSGIFYTNIVNIDGLCLDASTGSLSLKECGITDYKQQFAIKPKDTRIMTFALMSRGLGTCLTAGLTFVSCSSNDVGVFRMRSTVELYVNRSMATVELKEAPLLMSPYNNILSQIYNIFDRKCSVRNCAATDPDVLLSMTGGSKVDAGQFKAYYDAEFSVEFTFSGQFHPIMASFDIVQAAVIGMMGLARQNTSKTVTENGNLVAKMQLPRQVRVTAIERGLQVVQLIVTITTKEMPRPEVKCPSWVNYGADFIGMAGAIPAVGGIIASLGSITATICDAFEF